MKVLLTAFEPFCGESSNSSLELLHALDTEYKAQIPVSYARAPIAAKEAIEKVRPDAVILMGQARGRKKIMYERVALNIADAAAADNDGVILRDTPVYEDGENAYFSTLSLPLERSYHAGTFVCNSLYYALLHDFPDVLCTFVHIPATEDLPTEEAVRIMSNVLLTIGAHGGKIK